MGAGPAGISAATNAARHRLAYTLFEKGQLANTIYQYQRGKHVMAHPMKLPLRSLIPFQEGTRETQLAMFDKSITDLAVNVVHAAVKSIKKVDGVFELAHGDRVTRARHVVLSIGVQGTPRKLGCPGEELPHVAYTLADPDEFASKNILVVGAGDAAIENAVALSRHNTVAILNRSAEFARAKDGNIKAINDLIASGKIRCFATASVKAIAADRVTVDTPDGEVEWPCDRVIVRAGADPPRKFLESCGIDLPKDKPGSLPKVDARYMSSVEGLFVVGALIGYPLIKQCVNQGYDVIEHIVGNPVQPADAVLIKDRLGHLPGSIDDNYRRIRDSLPLFAELTDPEFRELIIESPVHFKQAGDVVFERLDYTDTFWSVVSGSVDVHLDESRRINMTAGSFFGELGLISGRRRAATVSAHEPCILVETPRKQMLKLISSIDSIKRTLDETFILRMLPRIFPKADRALFVDLVKKAQLRQFKKGEALFVEGDIGDALHVIRRGSVKVSRKDPSGADITRSYMPAGNYLGEIALLDEQPSLRTATVTAVVGTETIAIDKASFRALLDANADAREQVREMARQRQLNDVTTGHNKKEGAVLDFMFKEGVTDASNLLIIDSDLCVACNNCETACAATHDGTSRLNRQEGKFYDAIQIPISCRHCENPLCMLDCPPDALTRNPDGEVIIRDSCIGCGNCVHNCPYGVPKLIHIAKPGPFNFWEWIGLKKKAEGPARAAKCDLCSNLPAGPACVRACPTGAAERVSPSVLADLVKHKQRGHAL